MKYWLITYSWVPNGGNNRQVISYALHEGFIANWVVESLNQPESWKLINQIELTYNQYHRLRIKNGAVG